VNSFLLLLLICHVLTVAVAIWGTFNKSPWVHVPAIVLLMTDLIGLMVAQGISTEGMLPASAGWIFLGPVFLPGIAVQAIAEAPFWILPLLAFGVAVGAATWTWLWRRAKLRVWTFAAVLAGAAAAWMTAEVSIEVAMRTKADEVGGYCNFHRLPAPSMFTAGLSDFATPSHGNLTGQTGQYIWSFKETRWVLRERCDELPCWCYRGSHGIPNKPRS
jgi:hypothetical protein